MNTSFQPTKFGISPRGHCPRPSQSGVALLIVMISIFVLTMLALGFAYSMKVETRLAANSNNEVELQWLGRSGVEYARWILAQQLNIPQEPYDALNQVWAGGSGGMWTSNSPLENVQSEVQLGHGSFKWKIIDLERKFNINTADEVLLQQAFTHMGLDAGDTAPLIGSILNWTAAGNNVHHLQGADPKYYESLEPPYQAKNGPIDDITELLLIRGVAPELYWGGAATNHTAGTLQKRLGGPLGPQPNEPIFTAGLVDLFTPVSSGKININTCSAEVLEIIPPGIDPLIAEAIVAARSGEDDGSGLMGPYRSVAQVSRVPEVTPIVARQIAQYCDVRSRTFEVHVDATVAGYTRRFIALLGRNSPRDVQVLSFYWETPGVNRD
jgi:type II secretory pathway component PulK